MRPSPVPARPRESGAAAAREAKGVLAPSTSLRAFAASPTRCIRVPISIPTASISLLHFVASARHIERFEASCWGRRGQSRPFEFANRLAEIRQLYDPPGALDSRPLHERLQHQSSALLARLRHLDGVRRRTRTAKGGFKPASCLTPAHARQHRSVSGFSWMKDGGHVTGHSSSRAQTEQI